MEIAFHNVQPCKETVDSFWTRAMSSAMFKTKQKLQAYVKCLRAWFYYKTIQNNNKNTSK